MEAIILVGGLGTRLRPVVKDLPKPMAMVHDKPFLEYLLNYLVSFGLERVILAVGYRREAIFDYFGKCYRSCEIVYSVENEPLGTGGAIQLALDNAVSETLLILNGDTFFQVPLDQMLKFHKYNSADLTMALKPMKNFSRYGNVVLSNRRIISFEEKKHQSQGLINAGLYWVNKKVISKLNKPGKFSFEEYLSTFLIDNRHVLGFVSDGYFIDIGVPEDYSRAQSELVLYA